MTQLKNNNNKLQFISVANWNVFRVTKKKNSSELETIADSG